jgi:fructosamine-3-kinase
MQEELKFAIRRSIEEATGTAFEVQRVETCGGGCINDAVVLYGVEQKYFVKRNTAAKLEMFIAEAAGLEAMRGTETIYVPYPITHGCFDDTAYLVLEALKFGRSGDWGIMGRQLAKLHQHTADRFGWERNNTIGSTPQHNTWAENWADFFRDYRLGFQFELAQQNGSQFEQADALLESVPGILRGHAPEPSLLHGDLWSGNASFLVDGQPVIYDPACYYGDRETDLAFSQFFGGFPSEFYQGYQSEWPLADGYERRKTLYNLYHVLNHANLFGGRYAGQAQQMIRELLGN